MLTPSTDFESTVSAISPLGPCLLTTNPMIVICCDGASLRTSGVPTWKG